MAALVVCSLFLCPAAVFKKLEKYRARKAAEKDLNEEPEELEKEHRKLWTQNGNQPPSYEDIVKPPQNPTVPDVKMPRAGRGLGNAQRPMPELVH